MLLSAAACAASCSGAAAQSRPAAAPPAARTRLPGPAASVLAGPADTLAAGAARELLASAPVVVVASAASPAGLAAAAARAERAHAPLLLAALPAGAGAGSGTAADGPGRPQPPAISAVTRAEIMALHPRAVLAAGVAAGALSAELAGIRVVTDPARLPATGAPRSLHRVVLLVHQGGPAAATMAAAATAQLAGARLISVHGYDPRADPAAITALCAARPRQVVALGAGFGPPGRLAARLAVAVTGVQLPGGGQVLFPLHRLVALYGHPGAAALGALGQQGLRASIRRVREAAAPYRALSRVPVVPAFEIIATVAQGSPGPDGSYSYESPVASLRPWVRRAITAGLYVVLDLQPGRASLLAQAERYRSLLKLPDVGLALDPEWKLQPGQLPLKQIGSVRIAEVNTVISWLAALTARYHLPQKLLVLHQFELSMIRGERQLNTHHDDLAIVIHMDGQGSPGDKQQTWDAVTGAAPPGVFFGWKNFYRKDHPMLSPVQTMARSPQPVMISYQ
ncbi:MAG: hypothetical protein ACLPS1_24875 [Streptosporangiaceae bacterium]